MYINSIPVTFATGGSLKFQQFNTSGTFTPSAALLAAGGTVQLQMAGGGGGGGSWSGYVGTAGGGGGSSYWEQLVTVTGAVTVTIGAGGAGTLQGGTTSFGGLASVVGGFPGCNTGAFTPAQGGAGAGYGVAGESAYADSTPYMVGGTGGGMGGGGWGRPAGATNSGGGGAGITTSNGGTGGSGFCRVIWSE